MAKTELAASLAGELDPAPGARIIRGDIMRKRLMNVAPETRLPPTAYDDPTTESVYDGLCRESARALAVGTTAIVDMDFLGARERRKNYRYSRGSRGSLHRALVWRAGVLAHARHETRSRTCDQARSSGAALASQTDRFQCAPMARNTSGGRIHPDSCRLDLVADERLGRATGRAEAS